MKHILSSVTLMTVGLLLTGCGGGGSSDSTTSSIEDQIGQRDAIIIVHNYPADVCTADRLKDEIAIESGATNIITVSTSNSVTCNTYGRQNDGYLCTEAIVDTNSDQACVIGVDIPEESLIKQETILTTTPESMIRAL